MPHVSIQISSILDIIDPLCELLSVIGYEMEEDVALYQLNGQEKELLSEAPWRLHTATKGLLTDERRELLRQRVTAAAKPVLLWQANPQTVLEREERFKAVAAIRLCYTLLRELADDLVSGGPGQTQSTHTNRKKRKKRKKTATEILRQARETQAAKLLAENPNITCSQLAALLEIHKSTVIRLVAWQKRHILDRPKPGKHHEQTQ